MLGQSIRRTATIERAEAQRSKDLLQEVKNCQKGYLKTRLMWRNARYEFAAHAFVISQRLQRDRSAWRSFAELPFFEERKHRPCVGEPEHLLLHMLEYMMRAE